MSRFYSSLYSGFNFCDIYLSKDSLRKGVGQYFSTDGSKSKNGSQSCYNKVMDHSERKREREKKVTLNIGANSHY